MLQASTITFLRQLKKHNERSWFDEHKEKYTAAKTDFENFIGDLLSEYGKTDPAIGLLKAKDCIFRIYRDIRFSKNKTPYKTHLSAGINKNGRRVHFPGYHLSIEPDGNSFVGGGIWRPEREILDKIRQEIDYNYDGFLSIINKPSFKKTFGTLSFEDTLVRPPRGYEADNPAVKYLKLRSFTASCHIKDEDLTSAELVRKTADIFEQLKPFISFLGTALDG